MKSIILLVGLALIVAIVIPTINAEPLAFAEADADADAEANAAALAEALAEGTAEAIAEALPHAKFNFSKLKKMLHDLAVKGTDWAREQLEKGH